jgi:beta-aspartyl-dipeptidase (metallo-type)
MKTMAGLLAKAKARKEEGISAYLWSGGYNVPPASIMGSIREDMMFIDEVIGCGELAISDERALEPTPQELARVVTDTRQGGKLSKKAGITHFHVGPGKRRMKCIEEMLDDDRFEVDAAWLYPTHIGRSEALMRDAIALAERGSYVDVDVQEEDLAKWVTFYVDNKGDVGKLTVSSDASIKGPKTLFAQVRACARGHRLPMDRLLALVTSNTADVLHLARKGRLAVGRDGDILVLEKDEFELVHVLARGKPMITDGSVASREQFLQESNRHIQLDGKS